MKRRILTLGAVLLSFGLVVVGIAPDTFESFEKQAGLTRTLQRQVIILEPTAMQVSSSNYSFITKVLKKGTTLTGNFTVLSGGRVSIMGLDEGSFARWASNQGAEVLFFTQPSRNGTFTFQPRLNSTYFFVVNNDEIRRTTLVISLQLAEEVRMPLLDSGPSGLSLLAIGTIITGLGLWHENRIWKSRRREKQAKS